jgi:hypothetical protein
MFCHFPFTPIYCHFPFTPIFCQKNTFRNLASETDISSLKWTQVIGFYSFFWWRKQGPLMKYCIVVLASSSTPHNKGQKEMTKNTSLISPHVQEI